MPTREEQLDKLTFKNEKFDLELRVFYTLTDSENVRVRENRTIKTLSLLIRHLHDRNVLSDEDIDEILLNTVL